MIGAYFCAKCVANDVVRFCRRVISATSADELNHVRKIAYNYVVIGIDEGQFVSSTKRVLEARN